MYDVMLRSVILSVVYAEYNNVAQCDEGHYAECRYARCHYAKCHYAERRYAVCRCATF